MWIPAVGLRTGADYLTKNIGKFYGINIDNIPYVIQDALKEKLKSVPQIIIPETHFDSYFDAEPPFQLGEALLTGSLSEGLFLYYPQLPDMDFMCVLKNITLSQEDQATGCLLLREDTPSVYAFITSKEIQNLWSEFLDDTDNQVGKHRLSSKKLKEKLQENYQKNDSLLFPIVRNCKEELEEVTEGAAATVNKSKPDISFGHCMTDSAKAAFLLPLNKQVDVRMKFKQIKENLVHSIFYKMISSSDIVLSIFCEGWPPVAREWVTRERFWPDIYSDEKITQGGFHIVPKSSPDGDFRLSFSCAEIMLIKTLSPLQHKVMRAFKAVVKYHENSWGPNLKEILSSYYLKTIAFWHFEKTLQESWTEETLVHHLVALLEA
ncbi:Hypothetical predicted protein [Paramuricea clavata]|uniref:Mab-21-like nucleotidyltransferase domain-containing protein n=1 Tax=Paramuricea clavata TaxID=317549 RepID=A0A6S7JVW4_PARCT|nr:Hypothetical predicted protein [Paramuricea clavata]